MKEINKELISKAKKDYTAIISVSIFTGILLGILIVSPEMFLAVVIWLIISGIFATIFHWLIEGMNWLCNKIIPQGA